MTFVQNTINSIRNVRGELSIPPSKDIEMIINFSDKSKETIIKKYQSYFLRLARVIRITGLIDSSKPKHSASAVVDGGEVFIPLAGLIDVETEHERIQKEIIHVEAMVENTENKLINENFVSRAPKDIVEKEREKLNNFKTNLDKLRKNLAAL
jgi:valyl-tRNA synthetase